MFKYIVTYIIVNIQIVNCPRIEPVKDEFGRTPHILIQTSEACYRYDTSYMEKEFTERKQAIEFIKRGLAEKEKGYMPYVSTGELSNFKLDSVKIKK